MMVELDGNESIRRETLHGKVLKGCRGVGYDAVYQGDAPLHFRAAAVVLFDWPWGFAKSLGVLLYVANIAG